jgi:hypothetical protein
MNSSLLVTRVSGCGRRLCPFLHRPLTVFVIMLFSTLVTRVLSDSLSASTKVLSVPQPPQFLFLSFGNFRIHPLHSDFLGSLLSKCSSSNRNLLILLYLHLLFVWFRQIVLFNCQPHSITIPTPKLSLALSHTHLLTSTSQESMCSPPQK